MTTATLASIAYVAGLAALSIGFGVIYLPAGLIAGGSAATASALFWARGERR